MSSSHITDPLIKSRKVMSIEESRCSSTIPFILISPDLSSECPLKIPLTRVLELRNVLARVTVTII